MTKFTYVPLRCLPSRAPVTATILWPTVIHYWQLPQWVYGVAGFALFLLWVSFALWFFNSTEIKSPIFAKPEDK